MNWPDQDHGFITTLRDSTLIIYRFVANSKVSSNSSRSSQALMNAQLLNNPTNGEIAVSFEMGRAALVSFELRDVLGRAVSLPNAKFQLEQSGTHAARIPAPNLPSGTYYLRLVADGGEVRTLKLVIE